MSATPKLKIYNPQNQYIASCKYGEDAAALVALNGDGSTVRLGHTRVIWREGAECQSAGDAYDYATVTMYQRIEEGPKP